MGEAPREAHQMTSPIQMLSWFLLGALAAFLGMSVWIDSTVALIAIPSLSWTIPLVLALALLASAWQVRAMAKGATSSVTPLTAARIAILCQACSRAGMLLAGIGLGAWLAASDNHAIFLDQQAAHSLWMGLASAALGGVGRLGEWWCSIDDDEEEPPGAPAGA